MNFLIPSKSSLAFLFLTTVPLVACGSSDSNGDMSGESCVNGATETCTCDSGAQGAMLCVEGQWDVCDCSGNTTSTGGSTSSGGSTSAGTGGITGSVCGNGVIESGEMCDGANVGNETCASVTLNASPTGTLTCSSSCTFVTAGCTGNLGTGGFGGTAGFGGTSGGGGVTGGGGLGGP